MVWILLLIVAVVLFIVGVTSPHLAGKIQYKTDVETGSLKRMTNWLWDPLAWWAKGTVEMSRKVVKHVTQWGRRTRGKLPF